MGLQEDINFGKSKEKELLQTIQDKFGEDLKPSGDTFAPFDFVSDTTEVELKSRTCKKDTYRDTMIGVNKIYHARKNSNKEFYFCFNFTDGLYYFNHSNTYKYNCRFSAPSKREATPRKTYAYIPVSELIKV